MMACNSTWRSKLDAKGDKPGDSRTSLLAVARSAAEWNAKFGDWKGRTVVTVGNFDGVHLGHQKILQSVEDWYVVHAKRYRHPELLIPAVLTFYPHPACVVRPQGAPRLLMTLEQRLAAFEQAPMHAALVLRFDNDLAQLSPEEFVQRYLVETMRAAAVLVGANFRFGHRQSGDVNRLREFGVRFGFEVHAIRQVVIDGIVASSTAIREALRAGRIEDAHKLLGRPYALAGEIRPGTGQGRLLVVPTLNLSTEQELLPKLGVYAIEVALDGQTYAAATNVGVRPTFNGANPTVESHLLDFHEERTSGSMEVRFLSRLRDEQKFPNAQALREQVLRDVDRARDYFETRTRSPLDHALPLGEPIERPFLPGAAIMVFFRSAHKSRRGARQ
jgi:riboflavin kinase/FMN adenylyltransferase